MKASHVSPRGHSAGAWRVLRLIALASVACASPRQDTPTGVPAVTISIVGTNDLHGGVLPREGRGGLALLTGYVDNLRAARDRNGGAVLLVDAGDMFQGTLESNLNEGAVVVAAYNALGYTAAAIGNHEFDYGPVGDLATPHTAADDPRGALKARAVQARFPLLAANIIDESTDQPVDWTNVRPSTTIVARGVTVGIIGVTTSATLTATIAANTNGLRIAPLAPTIAAFATKLRAGGAAVIVVAAHAGGRCTRFEAPEDLSSCESSAEIVEVARALPVGVVDVIIAGHTHAAMAHEVNGIAILEAYSGGRSFSRVDLTVDPKTARISARHLFAPRDLCEREDPGSGACAVDPVSSQPAHYEGLTVVASRRISEVLAPAVERAARAKAEPLGVVVDAPIRRATGESALGNLVADLLRESRPRADIAIMNGGGLRTDLPAGPLTYGAWYEALPFDNRLVEVSVSGRMLREIFAKHLAQRGPIAAISGVRIEARCEPSGLVVRLTRESGRAVRDEERLRVATTDFLATGGDGMFSSAGPLAIVDDRQIEQTTFRDVLADRLRRRGGPLHADQFFDPARPRLAYPGKRPVTCAPQ